MKIDRIVSLSTYVLVYGLLYDYLDPAQYRASDQLPIWLLILAGSLAASILIRIIIQLIRIYIS